MKNKQRVIRIAVGIPLILIGIQGLFVLRRDSMLSIQSVNLPKTEGIVVKSDIKSSIMRGGQHVKMYVPDVNYNYIVSGNNYTGSKFSFPTPRSSKIGTLYKIKEYAVGSKTIVYYNPDHPDISCLKPKAAALWQVMIFVIGYFVFIAAGIWLIFPSKKD